jgi:4-amino-4-deoxy-L-arabinose transferase-like glycosyltransferase
LPSSKLAKHGSKLLFLCLSAFYLIGLGSLPILGPDEPRYAEVAREMLLRRDLITPTLGGLPWFEKPSLLYWLMMASYRVFGVNEYAARLGPALCGLATGAFVWWAGRSVEGKDRETSSDARVWTFADWSALVFLASLGAIGFSRAASFDIVLTTTLTGALVSFFIAESRLSRTRADGPAVGSSQNGLLFIFYFFVGLSLLAKGLVGLVIPLGVIGFYFVLRREWPHKKVLRSLLWGLPLALLAAAVWYGPMIHRHGRLFIDQFIIQHHFARFLTNKYHHPQPFYYYLVTLSWMIMPWTAILASAFIAARRWNWRGSASIDRVRVFAFAWIVVPLGFFSISESKLPGYILPVLPAAALLVGERIRCFLAAERGEKIIRVTGAALLIVAGVSIWYWVRQLGLSWSSGVVIASAPLISGGVALFMPRMKRTLLVMFALSAVFAAGAVIACSRPLAEQDSVRNLMQTATARGYAATPVFYMLADDRTAEFYAGGRLAYQANGEPFRFDGAQDLAAAIRAKGGVGLVIIETRWEKQLTDYAAVQTEKLGTNSTLTLFVVRVR